VIDVRVHAAVRDEAEEVNVSPALTRSLEGTTKCRVLEDRPVCNGHVHAHQILEEDAAGADREVADLRVPHLPLGQSDGGAGGCERGVGIGRPEPVEDGRICELDRIARSGRGEAPAVENDERYEREAAI
jgi:hypothetical protein